MEASYASAARSADSAPEQHQPAWAPLPLRTTVRQAATAPHTRPTACWAPPSCGAKRATSTAKASCTHRILVRSQARSAHNSHGTRMSHSSSSRGSGPPNCLLIGGSETPAMLQCVHHTHSKRPPLPRNVPAARMSMSTGAGNDTTAEDSGARGRGNDEDHKAECPDHPPPTHGKRGEPWYAYAPDNKRNHGLRHGNTQKQAQIGM